MKRMIFFIGVLVSMFVISPAFAQVSQSPFYYLLTIDGINGDSLAKPYFINEPGPKPEPGRSIDILSFKEGITQMSAVVARAGAATGRAQFADLTIFKRIDKASVQLQSACARGRHIRNLSLSCVLKAGKQQEIYRLVLSEAVVSGVKFSGDAAGVLEEVSFNYGKIEWYYLSMKQDGSPGVVIKDGWDLMKQVK